MAEGPRQGHPCSPRPSPAPAGPAIPGRGWEHSISGASHQLPAGRTRELTPEKEQASFKKHAFTPPSTSPRRSSGCSGEEGTETRSRHPQRKPGRGPAHTPGQGLSLPAKQQRGPARPCPAQPPGSGAGARLGHAASCGGNRRRAQSRAGGPGPAAVLPPPRPDAPASSGTGGAILARRPGAFAFRFRVSGGAAAPETSTSRGAGAPARDAGAAASARRGARCPGSAAAGRAGWRREAAPPAAARVSGGRRRAVLTLAAGGARSPEPSERSGGGGPARPWRVHHGGQAAYPHGQREAQQEHHAARERRQDLEDGPGGEGVGRALAAGAVHLRGLRISHLPDHPEHPDGHVRGRAPGQARPRPQRCRELSPRPAPRQPRFIAAAAEERCSASAASHSRSLHESFRVF